MNDFSVKLLPFSDKLTDKELEFVSEKGRRRKIKKGTRALGGECLGFIYLISGEIRAFIVSEEGREITLFRLYEGDCCVLTASCAISQITFETHMTAEKYCDILIIDPHSFARLTDANLSLKCFMYELLLDRFSSVMWTFQQILFKGYDRRLAEFLLEEFSLGGSVISMTQEQIAKNTGSAREVVARMLKRFVEEGIILYKRGSITVKDVRKLRDLAH